MPSFRLKFTNPEARTPFVEARIESITLKGRDVSGFVQRFDSEGKALTSEPFSFTTTDDQLVNAIHHAALGALANANVIPAGTVEEVPGED